MKTAVFSARRYDQSLLTEANRAAGHELLFIQDRPTAETAALARGCAAVGVFVNDCVATRLSSGQIMATTVDSITDFERGAPLLNRVPGN